MKKSIYIIALLAIVFCGCDKGDKREPLTERGMQICNTWKEVTHSIIQDVTAQIFYLNDWIQADESERPVLEKYYFSDGYDYFSDGYVLDKGDGVYEIYRGAGSLYMLVNTYGTELSQSGAVWEIHKKLGYSFQAYSYAIPAFVSEPENVFYMTYLGGNSWEFVMDSATSAGSSLDLTIRVPGISTPVELFSHCFSVEGNGSYCYSEMDENSVPDIVSLQFDVQEDLVNGFSQDDYLASTHYWDAGKVSLAAKKQGRDDIDVLVEYIGGGSTNISYRGVTEQW